MKLLLAAALAACGLRAGPCSPSAMVASGGTLYIACYTARRVHVFDTATQRVKRAISTPAPPSGLALSPDGTRLHIVCRAPRGVVRTFDLRSGKFTDTAAGHMATAPAASPDGKLLYVANQFTNQVTVIDLGRGTAVARIAVAREPVAAVLNPDGSLLFVANALPAGRADVTPVAAEISVIDTRARAVVARLTLPNGATGLRGMAISPDGRTVAVTHVLARFYLPTTQLERGWMATNAVSFVDVAGRRLAGTVLLDEIDRGAANPWAVAWTPDARTLIVTHAGTHEASLIDWAALLKKLAAPPREPSVDLAFLTGLRTRVPLAGQGPRALAVAGGRAWVGGYFSDTLETINLEQHTAGRVARLSSGATTTLRRGEMLFNDGSICFQNWQSCATCHAADGRVDGLNWDLLNDGIGNPKNSKSMLLAHRTPPSMSQGVREDASAAVRAGLEFILFARVPESDAAAIDAYLKSLRPEPSPYLENGKLSAAARRGQALFRDPRVGCARCHPAGLFTDLKAYDVGTRAANDPAAAFDTPTLYELWRTAPYLHDGSAVTLYEVLTKANAHDRHGRTSHLSKSQVDDLVTYLLSL